jgi:outer membrane lipoprotein LolB
MTILTRTIIAVVALSLTACASVRPVRDANNVNDQVTFSMDGRFGVTYIDNGEDKSTTGKIEWQETRRATDIILATPLGNAMASLHITPHEAVLKSANGDMLTEKTPEELLYRALGYELPISLIQQAIGRSGQPAPDRIGDRDWDIAIASRFDNGKPKKIIAERQRPSPLTMTVFIDERSDASE